MSVWRYYVSAVASHRRGPGCPGAGAMGVAEPSHVDLGNWTPRSEISDSLDGLTKKTTPYTENMRTKTSESHHVWEQESQRKKKTTRKILLAHLIFFYCPFSWWIWNIQTDAVSLLFLKIAVFVLNAHCKSFLNTAIPRLYGGRTDSGGAL